VEAERCKVCGGPLKAYKTTASRRIASVCLGGLRVVESQARCGECNGSVYGSESLLEFAPPGEGYAYDTIAFVGWSYFREGLSTKEIAKEFEERTGVRLPERTVSDRIREFLEYVGCVHEESARRLRADFAAQGGYVAHFDGTWELGGEVLFLCIGRVGGRTWVLGADKLGTENEEGVAKLADRIRRQFGPWLAAVRDLSLAIHKGLSRVAKGGRQFACHSHFVRDVGKKLLGPRRQDLLEAFRTWDVTRQLSTMRTYARRILKEEATGETARALEVVLECPHGECELSSSMLSRGLTCVWSQWLRAYRRDGKGQSFPFAHPELDYVERCKKAYEALEKLSKKRFQDVWAKKSVERLLEILRPVCRAPDFTTATHAYRESLSELERFRRALRTPHQRARAYEWTGSVEDRERQADALEQLLTDYVAEVEARLGGRLSGERRRCLEIIAKDLEKHGPYLQGHALIVPDEAGWRVVVVDRTNNALESVFCETKRAHRRRNGQRHVGRELRSLPAEAALTLNLRDKRYMDVVYGGEGWHRLAEVFPRVRPLVEKRRAESKDVPLEDIRLRPKQLSDCDMPERLARVYDHQLTTPEAVG
jgi:hypothetical protein